MFNIIEQDSKEVVRADRGRMFDKNQLACLMESESIVEQIVKSVLSSTKLIVTAAEIVRDLVDKSFDNQRMKNLDGTLTSTILRELSH